MSYPNYSIDDLFVIQDNIQLSPEGEVNSGGYIKRCSPTPRGIVVLVLPNQLDKNKKGTFL